MSMPHSESIDKWSIRFARLALGLAFLSAVASRFGLWQGHIRMSRFAEFIEYTAEVNAFMPKAVHPYLAWTATVIETTLGLSLVLGFRPRETALASAALLFMFGTAMAISLGLKSPLDYSVFSAVGAALMLWRHHVGEGVKNPASRRWTY
jgi:uncharacterized membrane protein YphA (DoxX/SURF4 family)